MIKNLPFNIILIKSIIEGYYQMTNTIYTVYQTTNTINNKIYIGVHATTNPNDSYLGSGIAIKQAIEKYGKDKFKKEILFEYDNQNEAYLKETKIVNEIFIKRKDNYNMCIGGNGGKTMIGDSHWNYGKHHSQETKKKMSISLTGHKSYIRTTEWINNKSISNKGKYNPQFTGYYITPWGKFETANGNGIISNSTTNIWCKNQNMSINNRMLSKSKYLQSLNENPVKKTFKEIGFSFEEII